QQYQPFSQQLAQQFYQQFQRTLSPLQQSHILDDVQQNYKFQLTQPSDRGLINNHLTPPQQSQQDYLFPSQNLVLSSPYQLPSQNSHFQSNSAQPPSSVIKQSQDPNLFLPPSSSHQQQETQQPQQTSYISAAPSSHDVQIQQSNVIQPLAYQPYVTSAQSHQSIPVQQQSQLSQQQIHQQQFQQSQIQQPQLHQTQLLQPVQPQQPPHLQIPYQNIVNGLSFTAQPVSNLLSTTAAPHQDVPLYTTATVRNVPYGAAQYTTPMPIPLIPNYNQDSLPTLKQYSMNSIDVNPNLIQPSPGISYTTVLPFLQSVSTEGARISTKFLPEDIVPSKSPKFNYRGRVKPKPPTESPSSSDKKETYSLGTELYLKKERQKHFQDVVNMQNRLVISTTETPISINADGDIEKQLKQNQHVKETLLQQLQNYLPSGVSKDEVEIIPGPTTSTSNLPAGAILITGDGKNLKISPTRKSHTEVADDSKQIKTIVIRQPVSSTTTTTPKTVSINIEELTKGVVPPGTEYEVIRHNNDGNLEEVGKLPSNLPQKKVTFVILEEQPDGTVKVQGVKGGEKESTKTEGDEVDTIIKKLKDGEIKLPPSTKLSTKQAPSPSSPTISTAYSKTSKGSGEKKSNFYLPTTVPSSTKNFEEYYKHPNQIYPTTPSTKTSHYADTSVDQSSFQYQGFPNFSHEELTTKPTVSNKPEGSTPQKSTDDFAPFLPTLPTTKSRSPTQKTTPRYYAAAQTTARPQADDAFVQEENSFYEKPYRAVPKVSQKFGQAARPTTGRPQPVQRMTTRPILDDDASADLSFLKTPQNLNDILKKESLFAMAKFLRQSGLDAILNETGPYTIFVPTDKAFRTLLVQLGGPDKAEEKFKDNPRLLSGLLLHHVIPGAFKLSSLQDEMTGVSLAGTQLRVNSYITQDVEWNDVKVLTINGARVLEEKKDILIPQGVAHAIDRVMFPLPVGDLLQTLQSDRENRYNNFLKVISVSGLLSMFTGTKTYTVFAPIDRAFPELELDKLTGDRNLAKAFV
ncbi:unnamed protein product, partial [Bemisia tabaci]